MKLKRRIIHFTGSFLLLCFSIFTSRLEAVTFQNYEAIGSVYDATASDAEMRITVQYGTNSWFSDRYANVSYGGPLPFLQAYHDTSQPSSEEFDFLPNPNFVIVRWDAWDPISGSEPMTGSGAYISFLDGTASLYESAGQPTLKYFSYHYEAATRTMAMIWSNRDDSGGAPIPDLACSASLMLISLSSLGIGRWLSVKSFRERV